MVNVKKDDEVKSPVAPVESVEGKPVESKQSTSSNDLCWNCKNHGEENYLNDEGICRTCGFDKGTLYNLDLETEKHNQRQAIVNAQPK